MKPFESTENYLECILMLGEKKPCVHAVDVAHQLGVSKPTVSVTMKRLREQGYLTVSADGCLELTGAGQEIAVRIYERHKVLAQMFMSLGVSEETAFQDACLVEHDLSDETFACIKAHALQSGIGSEEE